MRDACVEKHPALALEPVPRVERDCMRLGIEAHGTQTPIVRSRQESDQHCGADPATPPGREHRHPPDVPIVEQSRGADCATRRFFGKSVQGRGVEAVPFQCRRHALLAHEDRLAHRHRQCLRRAPGDKSDRVGNVQGV